MNLILILLLTGSLNFPDNFINIESFSTKFVQTTQSPMFPEIKDNGILIVDGCHFRFEYHSNEKRITLCDCEQIYQINEDDDNTMTLSLEEVKNNPFMSLLLDRQSLKTNFVYTRVSDKPETYRLVPKQVSDKNAVFTMIKITFAESSDIPQRIEVIDENEQVITYEFSDFVKNPEIQSHSFNPGEFK